MTLFAVILKYLLSIFILCVFAESEVYGSLAELVASGQTDVNKWAVESNGDKYGETRIGETKAYCVIDFLFPKGEETIIMDWKTGSASPTHRNQLLGYVLAAQTEFAINPLKTTTKAVYIAENGVEEVAFIPTIEELENYKLEIALQAKEMYGYCADVDKNKPKDISEFEMTPHEKLCSYCNFKEYCGRDWFESLAKTSKLAISKIIVYSIVLKFLPIQIITTSRNTRLRKCFTLVLPKQKKPVTNC